MWSDCTQDLEISDSCYDKCTKGKPCHTCVFKDVSCLLAATMSC
jgi:hypothetical protein